MTIVRRQDLKMTFLMMKRIGMMMKMKRYLKKKKKKGYGYGNSTDDYILMDSGDEDGEGEGLNAYDHMEQIMIQGGYTESPFHKAGAGWGTPQSESEEEEGGEEV